MLREEAGNATAAMVKTANPIPALRPLDELPRPPEDAVEHRLG